MPYIKQSEQARLRPKLEGIILGQKGELTYAINMLMIQFMSSREINYENLSATKSAAHDAADEWQRRIIAKFEEHKIRENGDIFQSFIRKANI